MARITKEWLDYCTRKQQTVLLSSIRGCDIVDKNDISKFFIRKLRSTVLYDAGDVDGEFMQDIITDDMVYEFCKSLDKYPIHFILHLVHASEIIGFKHPDQDIKGWWGDLYLEFVHCFHMNPETEKQCDFRLRDGVNTVCHKT